MPPQPPFSLLETMRWEQGVALLDRHLSRSARAAAELGFAFDERRILDALEAYHRMLDPAHAHRVRLTISADGAPNVATGVLSQQQPPFRRAVLFPTERTADRFPGPHKTTRRELYDTALRAARTRGFDEAILVDVHGLAVEGTRTNVWVRRGETWLTPPISSGCVAGVYRAHLLESRPDCLESSIPAEELLASKHVALSNAVHGLVRIEAIASF